MTRARCRFLLLLLPMLVAGLTQATPALAAPAPNLAAGECSNWEPLPSASGSSPTADAIAAADASCAGTYSDQRDQCFWRNTDSEGVPHRAGWQCIITAGNDAGDGSDGGTGGDTGDGSGGDTGGGDPSASGSFDVTAGGWTKHPWSHDFDTVDDLDHWHAQDTLGSRDPNDRHVGKQTQASGEAPVTNATEFAKVASVDVAQGNLVMSSFFEDGEAKMPYLSSFAAFDTLDDGQPVFWTANYPRACTTPDGLEATLPCDFILDPTSNEYYIETNVNFEQASDAYKTWWAFWLYSRADQYDDDVDTGMEVDILEYVPYAAPDGFNVALFRGDDGQEGSGALHPPRAECGDGDAPASTPCDSFTANAPDTDSYLRAASDEYDACRADESCPPIRLDQGYHRIGLIYSPSTYAFYLDGYKFWETNDRDWITQTAELGILLTWEKDEGNAIEDADGNGVPGYLDDLAPPNGAADGVADWRRSNGRSPLGYGPWNQGWKNPVVYEGECLVRELGSDDPTTYTFDEAADRGISGNDVEIVDGTCDFRTHEQYYDSRDLESVVRVDYVHVWTKD